MRPVFVIIVIVFKHQSFEMPINEDNHVIDRIAAAAADEALGHAILPGAPNRSADRAYAQIL
jgi:hypothetical protein